VWPGVGRGLSHKDLPKHLFTVAALHARRALAAAEDTLDLLDRANSIGTSVELLAKSALAHISPTLIADKDPLCPGDSRDPDCQMVRSEPRRSERKRDVGPARRGATL
jgi:hypothetical protein